MYCKMFSIVKHDQVAPELRLICLDAPEIVAAASPGQFLHVRCAEGQDPLLRRPLSIHCADPDSGMLYLLYRIVGKGTSLLARKRPGECVDVMGPLGRGYTIPRPGDEVAVIAGGIGVAPVFFLLDTIKRHFAGELEKVCVFLGAASSGAMPLAGRIREMGFPLYLATDDGSAGFAGTVVDLFKKGLNEKKYHRIYACGPAPMLKGLAGVLDSGPEVEVSVEERMGCGVGACLSCACGAKSGVYARVCKDGPVFDLGEIVL